MWAGGRRAPSLGSAAAADSWGSSPGPPMRSSQPCRALPPSSGASLPEATCPPASLRRKAQGGGKRGLTWSAAPERRGGPGYSLSHSSSAGVGPRGPSADSAPAAAPAPAATAVAVAMGPAPAAQAAAAPALQPPASAAFRGCRRGRRGPARDGAGPAWPRPPTGSRLRAGPGRWAQPRRKPSTQR